jgi:large repetitive protein
VFVTANRITTATPGAVGSTGLAYRRDLTTGSYLALGSGQQTEWEHRVELDPTGRYGFFATSAAELPADVNGHTDFYRRDLDGGVAGPLVLATTNSDGQVVGGPIGAVTSAEYGRLFAADGNRVLVLTSQALVSGDTNRLRDLYAKDLVTGIAGSPVG